MHSIRKLWIRSTKRSLKMLHADLQVRCVLAIFVVVKEMNELL